MTDHSMATVGRRFRMSSWAAVALMVAAIGCGGPGDPSKQSITDTGALRAVVFQVPDAAVDRKGLDEFNSLFETPPTGPAIAKYGRPLSFMLEGEPSISGNSASLSVNVSRRSDDPNVDTLTPVGTVKWTAVKVGDKWKLKDTPLP